VRPAPGAAAAATRSRILFNHQAFTHELRRGGRSTNYSPHWQSPVDGARPHFIFPFFGRDNQKKRGPKPAL